MVFVVFFFNDTATTEIYTLSLHDALPIYRHHVRDGLVGVHGLHLAPHRRDQFVRVALRPHDEVARRVAAERLHLPVGQDRKSTRLNSSHANISYAVFCLKKKKYLQTTSYS